MSLVGAQYSRRALRHRKVRLCYLLEGFRGFLVEIDGVFVVVIVVVGHSLFFDAVTLVWTGYREVPRHAGRNLSCLLCAGDSTRSPYQTPSDIQFVETFSGKFSERLGAVGVDALPDEAVYLF